MGPAKLCLRVKDAVTVSLTSVRFKALSGPPTVMGRRVTDHQANDLFVSLLHNFHQTITRLTAGPRWSNTDYTRFPMIYKGGIFFNIHKYT